MYTRPRPIHLLVNIITRRVKGRFVRTLSCATLLLSTPPSLTASDKKETRADPSRFFHSTLGRLPFGFSPDRPSLRVIDLRIRLIIWVKPGGIDWTSYPIARALFLRRREG